MEVLWINSVVAKRQLRLTINLFMMLQMLYADVMTLMINAMMKSTP